VKKNDIFCVILFLVIFSACKEKVEPEPSAGKIFGFVKLVDLNGNLPEDKQGIKVSIQNTSDFAYTDSTGKYELKDLEPGIVNILFEKDSFGTGKMSGIENPGGYFPVIPPEVTLYQQPHIRISNISITNDDEYIVLTGTIPSLSIIDVESFISDSDDVSTTNFKYYHLSQIRWQVPRTILTLGYELKGPWRIPFHQGQRIYILVCFKNPYENTAIFDPEINMSYYTSHTPGADVITYDIQ
jgi:hypothetical protein